MIVIAPDLALSLAGSATENSPVIGWRNLVTAAEVLASSADAQQPPRNLANPATYLRWQSLVTTLQYLRFNVVSEQAVDYVGIARHNFGSGQIAVSVEYENTDAPGTFINLVPSFVPANDAPLLIRFPPTFLATLRLRLEPTVVAPRAAVVYVGRLLVMQRRIYVGHTPITMGQAQNVQHNWSEGGDFLGSVLLSEKRASSFSFSNLTPGWVRSELLPFLRICRTSPFFWAWRPGTYPNEVGYVLAQNDPRPVNQRSNGMMQFDMQIGGIAP